MKYRINNTPNAERNAQDMAKRLQDGDTVTVPNERIRDILKNLCRDKFIIIIVSGE